jgi:hypothetical protein
MKATQMNQMAPKVTTTVSRRTAIAAGLREFFVLQ